MQTAHVTTHGLGRRITPSPTQSALSPFGRFSRLPFPRLPLTSSDSVFSCVMDDILNVPVPSIWSSRNRPSYLRKKESNNCVNIRIVYRARTAHSTQHTAHSTQHTTHSTQQHTAHSCTQHIAHKCSIVHTAALHVCASTTCAHRHAERSTHGSMQLLFTHGQQRARP